MAKKKTAKLDPFEGEPVVGTSVRVTNAGDGLSKAMSVDNAILHRKDTVHVVLECSVGKVGFEGAKDVDGVIRVQTLTAGRATLVDAALVASLLDEQDRRIEEAAGINRIFG